MQITRRQTSDAVSQYRCGGVGRGISPPFMPYHTPFSLKHEETVKIAESQTLSDLIMTDGRMDGQSLLYSRVSTTN